MEYLAQNVVKARSLKNEEETNVIFAGLGKGLYEEIGEVI